MDAYGDPNMMLIFEGDQQFESLFLPLRVRLSPGAAFEGGEPDHPNGIRCGEQDSR